MSGRSNSASAALAIRFAVVSCPAHQEQNAEVHDLGGRERLVAVPVTSELTRSSPSARRRRQIVRSFDPRCVYSASDFGDSPAASPIAATLVDAYPCSVKSRSASATIRSRVLSTPDSPTNHLDACPTRRSENHSPVTTRSSTRPTARPGGCGPRPEPGCHLVQPLRRHPTSTPPHPDPLENPQVKARFGPDGVIR